MDNLFLYPQINISTIKKESCLAIFPPNNLSECFINSKYTSFCDLRLDIKEILKTEDFKPALQLFAVHYFIDTIFH